MKFEEIIEEVTVNEVDNKNEKMYYAEYNEKYYEVTPLMGRMIELARKEDCTDQMLAESLSRTANITVTLADIEKIKGNFVKRLTAKPVMFLDAIRFKVNLFKPSILKWVTRYLTFFYKPAVMVGIIATSIVLIVMALMNYEHGNVFTNFVTQFNPRTLVIASIIHSFIILFHELGHATAAARYNLPPGSIGFGIYFFTPVFYTNTTHAWKIDSRKRLLVDCGGIYFQMIVLIPLSLIFLQQKSEIALYLIIVNLLTIITNLNPLLKYDGYWIFADLLNLNNLRAKTFSITRYYILKYVFFRKPKEPADIKKIKPGIKKALIIYTTLTNILFAYFFFYFIPQIVVKLAQADWQIIRTVINTEATGLATFFTKHGTDMFNFIINTMIMLFLLKTTVRYFYGIFKFLQVNLFSSQKKINEEQPVL
jgi:putative peptide zinc metalloprotease protein